jgi:hypothetical protein
VTTARLPFYFVTPGKNEPHTRIPTGFRVPGWTKIRGEKNPGLSAIGANQERVFPQVFRQTNDRLGIFSTGSESGGFTGFSGLIPDLKC